MPVLDPLPLPVLPLTFTHDLARDWVVRQHTLAIFARAARAVVLRNRLMRRLKALQRVCSGYEGMFGLRENFGIWGYDMYPRTPDIHILVSRIFITLVQRSFILSYPGYLSFRTPDIHPPRTLDVGLRDQFCQFWVTRILIVCLNVMT